MTGFRENGFKSVADNCFSLSLLMWTLLLIPNMRRFINRGIASCRCNPYGRISELRSDYRTNGKRSRKITVEARNLHSGITAHWLVRIGLKAKEIPTASCGVNLVFLIDVSGSM